jgi:hypothetical protein
MHKNIEKITFRLSISINEFWILSPRYLLILMQISPNLNNPDVSLLVPSTSDDRY